ncbi:MAG: hypothetical protein H6659_11750 [Ardenticatenaceae bacterium]|nr:hypothetical protein [Ardenticatenaceae bacterium]
MLIDALTQIGSLQLETGQKGKVGGVFFSTDAQEKALEYYVLARQWAQKLDQPQAERPYLLNIGNVLLAGDEQAPDGS